MDAQLNEQAAQTRSERKEAEEWRLIVRPTTNSNEKKERSVRGNWWIHPPGINGRELPVAGHCSRNATARKKRRVSRRPNGRPFGRTDGAGWTRDRRIQFVSLSLKLIWPTGPHGQKRWTNFEIRKRSLQPTDGAGAGSRLVSAGVFPLPTAAADYEPRSRWMDEQVGQASKCTLQPTARNSPCTHTNNETRPKKPIRF